MLRHWQPKVKVLLVSIQCILFLNESSIKAVLARYKNVHIRLVQSLKTFHAWEIVVKCWFGFNVCNWTSLIIVHRLSFDAYYRTFGRNFGWCSNKLGVNLHISIPVNCWECRPGSLVPTIRSLISPQTVLEKFTAIISSGRCSKWTTTIHSIVKLMRSLWLTYSIYLSLPVPSDL